MPKTVKTIHENCIFKLLEKVDLKDEERVMARNAKKYGIEAYYLIEEFDRAVNRIKKLHVSKNRQN